MINENLKILCYIFKNFHFSGKISSSARPRCHDFYLFFLHSSFLSPFISWRSMWRWKQIEINIYVSSSSFVFYSSILVKERASRKSFIGIEIFIFLFLFKKLSGRDQEEIGWVWKVKSFWSVKKFLICYFHFQNVKNRTATAECLHVKNVKWWNKMLWPQIKIKIFIQALWMPISTI